MWISVDQSSFMFGSLVHIHTNCMACAFCGAHPKWWVGKEIGLLVCEKCYEERGIATLPRSKLEELVRSLEAQKAEAEEAKKIAKREYPATTQFRGRLPLGTGSFSEGQVSELLEALASDCDADAKQLAGVPFSRGASSMLLEWETAYDSSDPSQGNPDLYGRDYVHVKKWRHIELEVKGGGEVPTDGDTRPSFSSIKVAVRSRLLYDIIRREEIGTEFQGGTKDIKLSKHIGEVDESRKILLDETIPASQIALMDDIMSRALHRFKTEVDWYWYKG
jgi:hypothetical protein